MKFKVVKYSYREFRWAEDVIVEADDQNEAREKAKAIIPETPDDEAMNKQSIGGAYWGVFIVPEYSVVSDKVFGREPK